MDARESWPRACLQVYTGDGKGKTTAALGLALRAAGHGIPVFFGQFMKRFPYGELAAAALLGGRIEIEQFGSPECLRWSEAPAPEDVARAEAGLARCAEVISAGRHGVVILDEVTTAVWFHLLDESALLAAIGSRPRDVEIVCTGRRAPDALVALADLVTEMREVKHPYAAVGMTARDGIER